MSKFALLASLFLSLNSQQTLAAAPSFQDLNARLEKTTTAASFQDINGVFSANCVFNSGKTQKMIFAGYKDAKFSGVLLLEEDYVSESEINSATAKNLISIIKFLSSAGRFDASSTNAGLYYKFNDNSNDHGVAEDWANLYHFRFSKDKDGIIFSKELKRQVGKSPGKLGDSVVCSITKKIN